MFVFVASSVLCFNTLDTIFFLGGRLLDMKPSVHRPRKRMRRDRAHRRTIVLPPRVSAHVGERELIYSVSMSSI